MKKNKKNRKSSARKVSKLPTRIFTFGARLPKKEDNSSPDPNFELIRKQILVGHRYYNKLIDLRRTNRQEYRKLRISLSPDKLGPLEEQRVKLEENKKSLCDSLRDIPKLERENHPLTEELKKIKSQLSEVYKEISKENKRIEAEFFTPWNKKFSRLKILHLLKFKANQQNDPEAQELLSAFEYENNKEEDNNAYWERVSACTDTKAIGPNTSIRQTSLEDLVSSLDETWPEPWKKNCIQEFNYSLQKKKLYESSGCWSGTREVKDRAAKRAIEDSISDPDFKRFDGTGAVGIQVEKNNSWQEILAGKCHLLKIIKQSPDKLSEKNKNKDIFYTAFIKLASKRKKKGLSEDKILEIDFIMHRPLPSDAIVKFVYLQVKKEGFRYNYEIQFTIESSQFPVKKSLTDEKIVFNLGWRAQENGEILVATGWDSAQQYHFDNGSSIKNNLRLNLPTSLRTRTEYVEKLLKYSDQHFDVAKKVTKSFLVDNIQIKKDLIEAQREWIAEHVPEEQRAERLDKFITNLSNIHSWRNHQHLNLITQIMVKKFVTRDQINALWSAWKEIRLQNLNKEDQDFFASQEDIANFVKSKISSSSKEIEMAIYLEWWRRKEIHLVNMARSLQKKNIRYKREIYRVYAANLARSYQEVYIQKWNKSETAQLPKSKKDGKKDSNKDQKENGNSIRQLAGISLLTQALKENFGKNFHEIDCEDSVKHVNCGGKGQKSEGSSHVLCDTCGKMYDQDINAACALWSLIQPGRREHLSAA